MLLGDPGHDLVEPLPHGVGGGQEVQLVPLREHHEGVEGGHALLLQHVGLRAVAADDLGLRRHVLDKAAFGLALFEDLHPDAHGQELPCQIHRRAAAADDHDIPRALPVDGDVAEQLVDVLRRADDADIVPRLEDEIAAGYVDLIAPLHGADERAVAEPAVIIPQRHAAEPVLLRDPQLHQLRLPLGKGLDLRGGGEAQHAADLVCRGAVGVYRQRKAELVPQEHHLAVMLLLPHAGDGVLRAELAADHAAEDVRLVGVGRGDEKIRLIRPGQAQDVRVRVPAYGHHVETRAQKGDPLPADVDHGDVMPLLRQQVRQRIADLSRSGKNDIHIEPHTAYSFIIYII